MKKLYVSDYESFDEMYEALVNWVNENYSDEENATFEYMEYFDEWFVDNVTIIEDAEDLANWWKNNGWTLDRGYGGSNYKQRVHDNTDYESIFWYIQDCFETDDVLEAILITDIQINDLVIFWEDEEEE